MEMILPILGSFFALSLARRALAKRCPQYKNISKLVLGGSFFTIGPYILAFWPSLISPHWNYIRNEFFYYKIPLFFCYSFGAYFTIRGCEGLFKEKDPLKGFGVRIIILSVLLFAGLTITQKFYVPHKTAYVTWDWPEESNLIHYDMSLRKSYFPLQGHFKVYERRSGQLLAEVTFIQGKLWKKQYYTREGNLRY